MSKIKGIFKTIGTSLVLASAPLAALAAAPDIGVGENLRDSFTKDDIANIIASIRFWFTGILGIIAIIMILYGAFLYLTAGGDEEKVGKAKKTVLYGAIGILIILVAYAAFTLVGSFLTTT